jgi:hypothetical protein
MADFSVNPSKDIPSTAESSGEDSASFDKDLEQREWKKTLDALNPLTPVAQAIGAINNIFTPPGRLSVNTPGFNPAGDQQSQAGVVDTVSNGTTQVVAASDDAGDAITREYLTATNNDATETLDSPLSTPTDLGEFYG